MHATFDPNCMLLQVYFTVAYSYECQNEIQSDLWSQRYVNFFTAATYNAEEMEESFLIVTSPLDKGKNSVYTFMLKLVDEMTFKGEIEFKNQFITGKLLYQL